MAVRPHFPRHWPALAALATIAGCNDSAGPGIAPECTGPVSVAVGHGTSPLFSWTPACRLFLLIVEDPAEGGDQWGVLSDSSNAILPPVAYGTIPAGATKELQPPEPLQAGHAYRVGLFRFTGPGHEDGVVIAEATFTP